MAQRSRIVLTCSEGLSNTSAAERLGVDINSVRKWRTRFLKDRLEGLTDAPRPGAPRTIGDADVERVVTKTLESKPVDGTYWSTRSMAQAVGLSQSAISRIWRTFALQPRRSEMFKLSEDPLFIDKVRDIVGLYISPPEKTRSSFPAMKRAKCRPWTARNRCFP